MRRKVLFVIPAFGIGGTTVSTRHLVSLLTKEGYDCWVMPLNPKGVLRHLYDDVQQVKTPFAIQSLAINSWKEESTWMRQTGAALLRVMCNISPWFEHRIVSKALDRIVRQHHFDTIVAGQEGITTRFVSYAGIKSKVAWIRCDYRRLMEEKGIGREAFYANFKAIVCVSEKTCKDFKEIYPEFAVKTYCIPNPQDGGLMAKRADEEEQEPRFTTDNTTIVSVGRLDAIKRFDQIVPIAQQLKGKGLRFRWYLIGEGAERKRIATSVKEYGMETEVVMLGAKANPYYYIKRANALVCLSRSEACPRVVNEAKILGTPTISADFPTIYEFIENEKTGLISSIDNMPDTILRFFIDNDLRLRIKENIDLFDFDNKISIDAIISIL